MNTKLNTTLAILSCTFGMSCAQAAPAAPSTPNMIRSHFFVGASAGTGLYSMSHSMVVNDPDSSTINMTQEGSKITGSLGVTTGFSMRISTNTSLDFAAEYNYLLGIGAKDATVTPQVTNTPMVLNKFIPKSQFNFYLQPNFAINSRVHFSPEMGVSILHFKNTEDNAITATGADSTVAGGTKSYDSVGAVIGLKMAYLTSMHNQFNFSIDYYLYPSRKVARIKQIEPLNPNKTITNRKVYQNMLMFRAGYQFNI